MTKLTNNEWYECNSSCTSKIIAIKPMFFLYTKIKHIFMHSYLFSRPRKYFREIPSEMQRLIIKTEKISSMNILNLVFSIQAFVVGWILRKTTNQKYKFSQKNYSKLQKNKLNLYFWNHKWPLQTKFIQFFFLSWFVHSFITKSEKNFEWSIHSSTVFKTILSLL